MSIGSAMANDITNPGARKDSPFRAREIQDAIRANHEQRVAVLEAQAERDARLRKLLGEKEIKR